MPGVDSSLLQPRLTWADPEAYDAKARELADMFRDNFSKFAADDNIVAGGPSNAQAEPPQRGRSARQDP